MSDVVADRFGLDVGVFKMLDEEPRHDVEVTHGYLVVHAESLNPRLLVQADVWQYLINAELALGIEGSKNTLLLDDDRTCARIYTALAFFFFFIFFF